jgi:transcriptional regulator with XRE-family HTH domain
VPRRPKPLHPDDGPEARFALALRDLRDRAGTIDPTLFSIDSVSRKTKISRQTIYAALNGRVPSRDTLTRLVAVWKGDVVQWLRDRSAVENYTESPPLANRTSNPTNTADREARREAERARWTARNRARSEAARRRTELEGWDNRHVSPAVAQQNEEVQRLAQRLDALRRANGLSLRQLSTEAGVSSYGKPLLPISTLSYALQGRRFPQWYLVQKVVEVCGGNVEEWRGEWIAMAESAQLGKRWISSATDPPEVRMAKLRAGRTRADATPRPQSAEES